MHCDRLFRNIEDIQKLSELGVLFLLFEMGLELSLDRLKVSQDQAHLDSYFAPPLVLFHFLPALRPVIDSIPIRRSLRLTTALARSCILDA